VVLYGGLALFAFWASFGPTAYLYSGLYKTLPMFAWLRAPARFGVLVDFALSVLAGAAVSALLSGLRDRRRARASRPWASRPSRRWN
jgi:hypothetical protein